jgi:Uma2 family endonuclease
MSTTAERMTADAFLAREDFPRYTQLLDGVVVLNSPAFLHQHVVGLIYAALLGWTQVAPDRGMVSLPLDVRVDDANVVVPDVLWFAGGVDMDAPRAPRIPDLAVEVRSPATWVYDLGLKREKYERNGLRELWLVDTASRTLLVYRRAAGASGFDVQMELDADASLSSPLLAGFAVTVGDWIPATR